MITLLTILKEYVFTGVTGNTVYDAVSRYLQKKFSKSLEELFLDAFVQAVDDQKDQLKRYGNSVSLDRETLRKALRRDLHMTLDGTALTILGDEEFVRKLAAILEVEQVLSIERHTLSKEDYEQLIRNLIHSTYNILRQRILPNVAVFNEILISEMQLDRQQLTEVQTYVADRFTLVLGGLGVLLERTVVLPKIAQQADLLPKISHDLEQLLARQLPQPFQVLPDTYFVGRYSEIERLDQLFMKPGSAVLLICGIAGMAGIGKSALAIHAAHRFTALFPDGILWADLREERPFDVLRKFAGAYGFDISRERDLESRAAHLRSILSGKRTLLILDNVQHDDDIRPLMPGSASVAVIVTSRQHLPSLRDAAIFDLDVLSESEAYELLTYYIGEIRIEAESQDAKRICRLVGLLPLALYIAGQQLKASRTLLLKDYADRLSDEQRRLAQLEIGFGPENNVRAAFILSYQELGPEMKRLFCLLSLFSGPDFGVEGAAALANSTSEKVRISLEALVNIGLLHLGQNGRYRMHDLLRLFAEEHLDKELRAQQRNAARLRLIRHYIDYVTVHKGDYDVLEVERNNILSLLAWARESYEKVPSSRTTRAKAWGQATVEVVNLMAEFLQVRGYWSENRDWLLWTTKTSAALHEKQAEAHSRYHLGVLLLEVGEYEGAMRELKRSFDMAAKLDDPMLAAASLFEMGYLNRERGEYAGARDYLSQAIELYEKYGDRVGLGRSLTEMGRTSDFQGDYSRAQDFFQRSAELQEESADRHGLITTLHSLGYTYAYQGEYSIALGHFQKCIALEEQLGEKRALAHTLHALGRLYSGNFHAFSFPAPGGTPEEEPIRQSRVYLNRALEIQRQLGDSRGTSHTLGVLAFTCVKQGDYEQARSIFEESLDQLEKVGSEFSKGRLLHELGWMWAQADNQTSALGYFGECLPIEEQLPDKTGMVRTLYELGYIYVKQGNYLDAKQNLQRSRETAIEIGDQRALGFIEAMLGKTAYSEGDAKEARRHWTDARGIFDRFGMQEAVIISRWIEESRDAGDNSA